MIITYFSKTQWSLPLKWSAGRRVWRTLCEAPSSFRTLPAVRLLSSWVCSVEKAEKMNTDFDALALTLWSPVSELKWTCVLLRLSLVMWSLELAALFPSVAVSHIFSIRWGHKEFRRHIQARQNFLNRSWFHRLLRVVYSLPQLSYRHSHFRWVHLNSVLKGKSQVQVCICFAYIFEQHCES